MSFYAAQVFENSVIRVSDSNYELYSFWKQLGTNADKLIHGVQNIYTARKNGRDLFNELTSRRDDDLTELERAVHFFILNRITFSGVVDAGGYSEASFQSRFTQSSIERLKDASDVVNKFEITFGDYSKLLQKNGKEVFIFLDPPYYSVSKSRLYGKKGNLHAQFDHQKFAEVVKSCKHKWLITYDNSEYVRDLFKDYQQLEWELQYGMNNYRQSGAAKGKELLIANYDLNKFVRR